MGLPSLGDMGVSQEWVSRAWGMTSQLVFPRPGAWTGLPAQLRDFPHLLSRVPFGLESGRTQDRGVLEGLEMSANRPASRCHPVCRWSTPSFIVGSRTPRQVDRVAFGGC